jgi:DNA-binding SARP family transcriptional activator
VSVPIHVLGEWQLLAPDGHPKATRLAVQRLLAFLAVRGRVQQRALVAGSLWPDSSDRRASANLRSTLWHARIESPGLVDGDATTLWLCEGVLTDFDEATAVLRAVLLDEPVPVERLASLGDDVLPEWDDEWLVPVRFLHRQLRLLALDRAAQRRRRDDHLATLTLSSEGRRRTDR